MLERVFLVSAVRTPIGVFGGSMRSVQPLDLAQLVITEALSRAQVENEHVDQVIMGNCLAPLDQNVARVASLLAGLPYPIPGYTINCACSSAMQATIMGAMTIAQGVAGVVVAGGVESMSNAPYILEGERWGKRLNHAQATDLLWKAMQEYPVGGGMGLAAERLADKYGLSRYDQDELAAYSHFRALRAIAENRFQREIVPVVVQGGKGGSKTVEVDENPRPDTTVEKLGKLRAAFKEGGSVTAGNASALNDGAAALVIASESKVKELGLPVLAEVKACSTKAVDPHYVGIASVPAIKDVLAQTGLQLSDIDLLEVNEAFASYYLACEKELALDREKTNVNGSGISLGHPVGCTGARLIVTLYHEMERQGLQRGVAGLCAGGGVGTAVMLER
ncbi:MAG: thiolase family protein [Proteobacteria bacterium]|nr:thiolase family protein [Pseudomonadota bacterium]MBU1451619.1 thiolase family protein [Pseudomonadota bacterium]MBU2469282.1 thiolase family protein [Pseudomonadota bacterium]MBU2517992.1 thiolase family protein [Pseudomonadota bacterium]